MIKLIVSDVDGTLFKNEETSMSGTLKATLQRVLDFGYDLVIASGRSMKNLQTVFGTLKSTKGRFALICENGAVVITDTSETVNGVIEKSRYLEILNSFKILGDCEVMVSTKDTWNIKESDSSFKAYLRKYEGVKIKGYNDFSLITDEVIKLSLFIENGITKEVFEHFKALWAHEFNVAQAGESWLDFTLANKGKGLVEICEEFNVSLGDVMAFGDNYNDLPMLELAGQPYIMENADENLKCKIKNKCNNVENEINDFLNKI